MNQPTATPAVTAEPVCDNCGHARYLDHRDGPILVCWHPSANVAYIRPAHGQKTLIRQPAHTCRQHTPRK